MVDISIEDDTLIVDVPGPHQVFAFKGALRVPLSHVKSARHDREHAARWWHGLNMMGTDVPGVFAAGTFWSAEGWRFWDVRHPENAITIELQDERFAEIIVEVEDPERDAAVITEAVRRFR